MILDPGTPISLAGRPSLSKYLAEYDYNIEDMSVTRIAIDCQ